MGENWMLGNIFIDIFLSLSLTHTHNTLASPKLFLLLLCQNVDIYMHVFYTYITYIALAGSAVVLSHFSVRREQIRFDVSGIDSGNEVRFSSQLDVKKR